MNQGILAPLVRPGNDNRLKWRSLPRGLPSDGSVFELRWDSSPDMEEEDKSGVNGQVDAKKNEEEQLEQGFFQAFFTTGNP